MTATHVATRKRPRHKATPARIGVLAGALAAFFLTGCGPEAPEGPVAIRLAELYEVPPAESVPAVAEPWAAWSFETAPGAPASREDGFSGWQAGPGVADLEIRHGRLIGSATGEVAILHHDRPLDPGRTEVLHAVEIRLGVSAGSELSVALVDRVHPDPERFAAAADEIDWILSTPLVADGEIRSYVLKSPFALKGSRIRQILIRPSDTPGARFAIASIRLRFRRELEAEIRSGRGWYGLSEIYRDTLAARTPEAIRFELTLPDRPRLDLAVGTIESEPMTFHIAVEPLDPSRGPARGARREVTTPGRWQEMAVDLSALAGERVAITLSLTAAGRGRLGFWGNPVVRRRGAVPAPAPARAGLGDPPQGVILIVADTLRRDHLGLYGYGRDTAPALRRMAQEGAVFTGCITQSSWTKVAVPTLLSSLYPSSHGVADFSDRLPSSAVTVAEVFRDAGYATMSLSSILLTGRFSNLHQGFEEVHESLSFPDRDSSKTARRYVDRLLPWLAAHRNDPFFVFLHVYDPHHPYKTYPPHDFEWADPAMEARHRRGTQRIQALISDPLRRRFTMPTRGELIAAGVRPEDWIGYERDLYDGSVLAMDAEIGRLLSGLGELGLDQRTLVVFTSDHGEEFLEHGRMFHGQGLYGEQLRVPLIFRWPGVVAPGMAIDATVELVDLMPTILELAGRRFPEGMQGDSLVPLLFADPRPEGAGRDLPVFRGWEPKPAFAEKATVREILSPPPRETESWAVLLDGWKLIRNTRRAEGVPEFELYDYRNDPLDRRDRASERPELVAMLAARLEAWRAEVTASRLRRDVTAESALSTEQLERLRSLGYLTDR